MHARRGSADPYCARQRLGLWARAGAQSRPEAAQSRPHLPRDEPRCVPDDAWGGQDVDVTGRGHTILCLVMRRLSAWRVTPRSFAASTMLPAASSAKVQR